ncbi:MAG: tyrosine recombinase [Planctomycetes bacterium]|nr:tyrosine recombinase [Planctomycetota bacterium]
MASLHSADRRTRDFLAFCRVECGLAPLTLEAYGRDLTLLAQWLDARGTADPALASMSDLADHIRWMSREKSYEPTTVTRHLATMRVFYRWLHATGVTPRDPARLLERPTAWKRLPGTLTPRQMKALMESPQPEQGALWLRDKVILELLYGGGLRASEICTVKVNDFHPTIGSLAVTGKGRKQRIVPIGVPAIEWTERYLKECRPSLAAADAGKDDYRLLLSYSGRPLERVAIWQLVKKHAALAGLKDVHPHTLRHSFATHLVTGGADLRAVQEMLGHANVTTTQVYTHVTRDHLRETLLNCHPREARVNRSRVDAGRSAVAPPASRVRASPR